jgi:DNA polymerase-3 subunit delta'
MLRFAPLPPDRIEAILVREAPEADAPTRTAAIAAADGSPGAALDFVGQDLGAIHGLMVRLLREGDEHLALRGALSELIGARPDRERQVAVADLARAVLAGELRAAGRERQLRIVAAHEELVRLSTQIPTFNYDPGLLVMEIGALLASAAMPRETAV